MKITTIGLDLAKHWFQVHGVDAGGQVVVRAAAAQRSDSPSSSRSAVPGRHGSLRDGAPLGARADALGHTVKLMPPAYVKAYVNATRTMRPMPRRSVRR